MTTSYDRKTIQNTAIYAITDQANGKSFGASTGGYSAVIWDQRVGRFSTTYVTGSHAVKAGIDIGSGNTPRPSWFTGDVTMTFNAGVPQSVTFLPREYTAGYFSEIGLYMQDRWTFKRATVTGGLRYDYFVGTIGEGRCLEPLESNSSPDSSTALEGSPRVNCHRRFRIAAPPSK